ncbi:MAG: LysR family transcriptional regulator [Ruminococcus sp.]|nr:LysR family transcriptional regulator [Ruminococcus sp.]
MKIQHLEYVIAIAREGSITKAAKVLYQAQPNISIALKDLEESLGIQIFQRTQSGMVITPEGEEFIERAKSIVEEFHSLEALYSRKEMNTSEIRVAATRSPYVAAAMGKMISDLDETTQGFSISLLETSTNKVIEETCNGIADIGVLRIPTLQLDVLQERLESKKLCSRTILEYHLQLMMHKDHPLTKYDDVPFELLEKYPEIIHNDSEPDIVRKASINPDYVSKAGGKKIYVYDRGTQKSMLDIVQNAYMWVGPLHPAPLALGSMTTRRCSYATCLNRDIIIYRKKVEDHPMIKTCIDYITKFADFTRQGMDEAAKKKNEKL